MNVNSWQKFLEGDEESFSELYRYYFSELFAYGTRIAFNEEVCKDGMKGTEPWVHFMTSSRPRETSLFETVFLTRLW